MSLIHIENLNKHFKVLNRREGLSGALIGLAIGWFAAAYAMEKEKDKKQAE